MKKLFLIFISMCLFANEYRAYKMIEMLNEIEHKKVKFLSLIDYNVFPIHIDNTVKIKQFIKAQTAVIDLRAISGNEAYINGKWHKKGDKIGNVVINKIINNCVWFNSENVNKPFKICLSPDLIRVNK